MAIKVFWINIGRAGPQLIHLVVFHSLTTPHRLQLTHTCQHLDGNFDWELPDCENPISIRVFHFSFADNIRIVHFIGENKPWLQHFNSLSREVSAPEGYGHLQDLLQYWWNLFCENVHPDLSSDMVSFFRFSHNFLHITFYYAKLIKIYTKKKLSQEKKNLSRRNFEENFLSFKLRVYVNFLPKQFLALILSNNKNMFPCQCLLIHYSKLQPENPLY